MASLRGQYVILRSPEPEDLDLLYAMENDPELCSTGSGLLPYSRYTLREYLKNSVQDLFAERQARFIIERNDGTAMGMIDLVNYDPQNRHAEVSIALLGEYRGRGYAGDALHALVAYSFGRLAIHSLYAYADVLNEASIALFKNAGFTLVACLRDWIRIDCGGYHDALLFQKVSPY